jgi:nuclease-like protein
MFPNPVSHVAGLKLRTLSAALVAVHALAGLAGLGFVGALVHAAWFGLLLSRKGRSVLLVVTVTLAFAGLVGCAVGSDFTAICSMGLAILAVCAWLAVRGVDELESVWHGHATEAAVRAALERVAARLRPRGRVRNAVLLRSGRNFTEIDHVVISAAGILVIETKGYAGRIDFDPGTGRWWRTRRGDQVEEIDSPLVQNEGHVRAIRRLFPDVPVFSLIVMPQAELGDSVPEGVVGLNELSRDAPGWIGLKGGCFDVAALVQRLDRADEASPSNRRAHFEWLHRLRGFGPHPLWQARRVAVAATLYFGVPNLVLILWLLFRGQPAL